MLPQVSAPQTHVWHLFVIQSDRRTALQEYLQQNGIQTLVHYPIAPHKQQAYRHLNHLSLPITESLHERVLSLPMSPVLTDAGTDTVIRALNDWK